MNKPEAINFKTEMSGRYKLRVLNPDGSVANEKPWQKNLVLNPGIRDVDSRNFVDMIGSCRAGTGTTPAKASIDGTFAISGTTLTRSTGTGVFTSGDVDNYVKFGTGEEHLITAFTSGTEVTVRDSATVAASTVEIYDTSRIALDAQLIASSALNGTSGANTETADTALGQMVLKRTYDFAAEIGTVNYNEVGVSRTASSDLLSRVVLASTVTVLVGQQLQVVFEFYLTCNSFLTDTALTPTITGWPWEYTNTGFTSTGSDFTVTFDDDHHYSVADEITISGATPAGYNGTWTIASVTADTVTVTDGSNLGVDSVPGTTVGSLSGEARFVSGSSVVPFDDNGGSFTYELADPNSYAQFELSAYQEANVDTTLGLGNGNLTNTREVATRSFEKTAMDSDDFSFTRTHTFDIDEANFVDLRQITMQAYPGTQKSGISFMFDQNQRKDSGFTLKWGYKITIRQLLD